jgi:hypothetical protein
MIQSSLKTVWQLLTKVNTLFLYKLAITSLGITDVYTKNLYMDVYISVIHKYQTVEATKMSFSRGLGKSSIVYPHNGILFSAAKK